MLNAHKLSTAQRASGKISYGLNLVNLSGHEIIISKVTPITKGIAITTNKIPITIQYDGDDSIGIEVDYPVGQTTFEIEFEATIGSRNVKYLFIESPEGFTLKEKLEG